ncbi:MAG: threonine ammonia-lyase [Firmicutes bacterium]|nr:threonine ammonia-lyase [Bacillota bacterium]
MSVTLDDIREAAERIRGVASRTPVLRVRSLEQVAGRPLFLKMENMQRTGSFKIRGAYNKISRLSEEERARGVVAASAGNHAQGVALAAAQVGTRAVIVMPQGAALPKVMATRGYGAEVVLHGDTYDAAYQRAREIERERGLVYVHAFNDPAIIAGQGTVALEILEDVPDADAVVVPIGGGGLISGVAVAVKALRPGARVIGVQAEGAAAVYESRRAGRPVELERVRTVADGLAIKRPEELTLKLIERYVDDIVLVSEDSIARAIMLLAERAKAVVEGAGAVALAAVLSGRVPPAERTVLVVSGGNIDLIQLARVIDHGLAQDGRYVRVVTTLVDRPGSLRDFLNVVAEAGANVIEVEHRRLRQGIALGETDIELTLETRNAEHAAETLRRLRAAGYRVTVASGAEG